MCLGYFPTGLFLMLASYAGCDQIAWSVACMVIATGFLAFNIGSYSSNHLDIGPRYAGILMGLTNTFGTIPGFVTPSLTGYFTNEDVSEIWNVTFSAWLPVAEIHFTLKLFYFKTIFLLKLYWYLHKTISTILSKILFSVTFSSFFWLFLKYFVVDMLHGHRAR